MRAPLSHSLLLAMALACSTAATSGCIAVTRTSWHRVSATGEVCKLSLARGPAGATLVIEAEGERWLLPLGSSEEVPPPLDASQLGGRTLEELRSDPAARASISGDSNELRILACATLRRATRSHLRDAVITPLRARIFRLSDGVVVAFYDTATHLKYDERLPSNAVILPERLPRTAANVAFRVARAGLMTPATLALDAIGSVMVIPAAIALAPQISPPDLVVWVNSDWGEFPPPTLFRAEEHQ